MYIHMQVLLYTHTIDIYHIWVDIWKVYICGEMGNGRERSKRHRKAKLKKKEKELGSGGVCEGGVAEEREGERKMMMCEERKGQEERERQMGLKLFHNCCSKREFIL